MSGSCRRDRRRPRPAAGRAGARWPGALARRAAAAAAAFPADYRWCCWHCHAPTPSWCGCWMTAIMNIVSVGQALVEGFDGKFLRPAPQHHHRRRCPNSGIGLRMLYDMVRSRRRAARLSRLGRPGHGRARSSSITKARVLPLGRRRRWIIILVYQCLVPATGMPPCRQSCQAVTCAGCRCVALPDAGRLCSTMPRRRWRPDGMTPASWTMSAIIARDGTKLPLRHWDARRRAKSRDRGAAWHERLFQRLRHAGQGLGQARHHHPGL